MTSIILFVILMVSFITDLRHRKILNIVTFPAMILGVVLNTVTLGWDGLILSFLGMLTGLGLLLIPYALGGMAAGDVKLLMAIGALHGTTFVLGSFLYITLIGGIIAFIILIVHHELLHTLKRMIFFVQFRNLDGLNKNELHHAFPYGVAIVLGTLCYSGVTLVG